MKTSLIIGIISLWVILTLLSNVAEETALMGSGEATTLQSFMQPHGTDFSNVITGTVSIVTNIWQYMKLVIQVMFLWYPTVWEGSWSMMIYFIPFLPFGIGLVFSIVTVLRGVGST
jgi:hypothetical protein